MRLGTLTLATAVVAAAACDTPERITSPEAGPAFSAHGTTTYQMRTVGTGIRGFDINDAGEVAGEYFPETGDRAAFFWSPSTGVLQEIPAPAVTYGLGHRLNNLGVVAGSYETAGGVSGYRWTSAGGLQPLQQSAAALDFVHGFNDDNVAVGRASFESTEVALKWAADGTVQELALPAPSRASAINVHGVIAGAAAGEAYILSPVTGFRPLGLADHYPVDINAHGAITGWYHTGTHRRAFYWSDAHGLLNLHELGGFGDVESFATGINDAGEVAVSVDHFTDGAHAYVWTVERGFVPLPVAAGVASRANAINNHGQVVGTIGPYVPSTAPTVIWTPAAASDLVDGLSDRIDDLVDGGALAGPRSNGLRATLTQIQRKLDAGNTAAAISQLRAFMNQVRALVASGHLSEADGAVLIAEAQALIDALSS